MLDPFAAKVLLACSAPIAVYVAWSDMKFMKIPNKAVLALIAVFLVAGFAVLPREDWLWGLALGGIVLVITFLMSTANLVGAGDAKFAAAMAPFFVGANTAQLLTIITGTILGAFVVHRSLKHMPAVRRMTPDWASWTHKKFPFGLTLAGTLVFYLSAPILTN
jgi:prepilin peptidase CpaA